MKKKISYNPYSGSEPYIYLCFSDSDTEEASFLMDRLYQRGCRFAYTIGCSRNAAEENERSRMMGNANLIIAIVSDAFKNDPYAKGNVLYLQSIGKPVILIKRSMDINALSLGLPEDTPSVEAYNGIDDDAESRLVCSEGFSHVFLGEHYDAKKPLSLFRISVAMLAVSVFVLIFAVVSARFNLFPQKHSEPDPLSVTELTLSVIPSDTSELEKYPNLEKLRIPQSEAGNAGMLLDRYIIVLYEEG